VNHIAKTGDWVVPTLAGEPFMEKPPLFFMTAAFFAKTFSKWCFFHDAARLAAGFFSSILLIAVGLTAKKIFGKGRALFAALLLAGCPAALVHCHQLITDVALIAGIAIALYGGCCIAEKGMRGPFFLGSGVGIAFLSKGLLAPGLLGITCIALFLLRPYRSKQYAKNLLFAAVFALPWLLIWPYALYQRSPQLFHEWFWVQNIGRYFGLMTAVSAIKDPFFYNLIGLWPFFPAVVCAAVVFCKRHKNILQNVPMQWVLGYFVVCLTVLSLSRHGRQLYALPLGLPLAILGSEAAFCCFERLKKWSGLFKCLMISIFGIVAFGTWLTWIGCLLEWPIAFLLGFQETFAPGYVFEFEGLFVGTALFVTILWLIINLFSRPNIITAWTSGVTLTWSLVMTLWLPFIDYGKGYSRVMPEMATHFPKNTLVMSYRLGEPQRALFDYYCPGKLAHRIENPAFWQQLRPEWGSFSGNDPLKRFFQLKMPPHTCLLIQGVWRHPPDFMPALWRLIWEGARPADDGEHFWLFEKM
jgi:4-amino-4-deoxy-L-arabinose transferase-like glycosyltransferase